MRPTNSQTIGANVRFRWFFAWALLILSVVGGAIDIWLYSVGEITQKEMVFHALVLSWLAITITAYDVVSTTDVRRQQDDTPKDPEP
jgi:hypothetical protein